MTSNGTDDVALFDVICAEDERTWRVPVFLSPLFRWAQMPPQASIEARREMVGGLGARAIAERLEQGQEPPADEPLVLATDYPGAPGEPDPLLPYECVAVRVDEAATEAFST